MPKQKMQRENYLSFCNGGTRNLFRPKLEDSIEELISNEARAVYDSLARDKLLPVIIDAYPDATKHANTFGPLPIHEAAAKPHAYSKDVHLFIRAAPDTVNARDSMDGLLPFMSAATSPSPDAHDAVSKIYLLLREHPEN